jgi:uncharacterized repeat protein (TIGR01451 family)
VLFHSHDLHLNFALQYLKRKIDVIMKKNFLLLLAFCLHFTSVHINAQPSDTTSALLDYAHGYIRDHLDEWGLSMDDIAEMKVSDLYTDPSTGITRVYFQQHYKNIPVYNAILNLSMTEDGNVFYAGSRFIGQMTEKVNTTTPVLTPGDAVRKLCSHLDISYGALTLKRQEGESQFVFENSGIATEDIHVGLSFQPDDDKVQLAWDVLLSPAGSHDKWSTRINAVNGEVLHEYNWTLYCHAGVGAFSRHENDSIQKPERSPYINFSTEGAQYNVWPAPIENPGQGERTIVTNPADTVASPFGWHDVDGQPGAEYTITRGNNAFAYQDRTDLGVPSTHIPDGGPELHFDFPYDPAWEPDQYMEASTVNLFYWLNYMHDFTYQFGFNEVSGNFQKNNYGRGGVGNDFLWGVAQAGADVGYFNNAFYRHNNEGTNSAIFMYVFKSKKRYLTINAPAEIAGKYFTSLPRDGWGAGAYVGNIPVSGEVVVVDDGIENPLSNDGCEDFINAGEVAGKIAFISRGGCQFGLKALKAQNAGALAVMIANFDDDEYTMAPGNDGASIHIPVIMLTVTDAQKILSFIDKGLHATIVNPGEENPVYLDSGFDAGVIAHEFGHGISCRLAGGPNQICFDHEEQMGEGWSDFFALATTVKPGDTGEMKRGFCTYLFKEPIHGRGFRRYAYSTDMNVMPLTFGDVARSHEEHDLGEVWASMLWDMYWALVDRYGWSEDPFEPSSGNHKAIRLVIEGLKNVPCNPGFVDARNGILAADKVIYNGENECLLWEVFARRGLGFSADQGSPFDAGDQKEAFDVAPLCSDRILIEKSVTDLIQAGDDISVTIKVGNFKKDTVTNLIVTDEIPVGTFFKLNSANLPAEFGSGTVSFKLGNMDFGEEVMITYSLKSAPEKFSKRIFLDEVSEESAGNWLTYAIEYPGPNGWIVTDSLQTHSGDFCWNSKEVPQRTRQALELNPGAYTFHVEGDYPVLRFYHRYKTKSAINGGVVDIKEIDDNLWTTVDEEMIRNGYTGLIDYRTFAIPNLKAFSGNSGENFKATYVDLQEWAGKDIQVRFRFGTALTNFNSEGWLIDDIEFMDLVNYNGEVCVTSDQGDHECAVAPVAGTIVDSRDEAVGIPTHEINDVSLQIYPNPATDLITLQLSADHQQDITIHLSSMDGKQLLAGTFTIYGSESFHINTDHLPAGVYLVSVQTDLCQLVEKVIVHK